MNIASFWAAFFVVLGGIIGKLIDYLIGRQKNKLENVEKGEGLFLPWLSFPLPPPSFLVIFTKKEPALRETNSLL